MALSDLVCAQVQNVRACTIPTLHDEHEVSRSLKGLLSASRIRELADAGYMPCWRIDGGPPLFVTKDVKDYIAANLVTKTQGLPFPRVLAVPSKEEISVQPPPELARLPVQYLTFCEYPPCVYFLVKARQVVYVGQSTSVTSRLAGHRDKDFDEVYWLPVPASELDRVEGALIRYLRPVLNGKSSKGNMVAPVGSSFDAKILQALGLADEIMEALNDGA